jgi:hypothetical protein
MNNNTIKFKLIFMCDRDYFGTSLRLRVPNTPRSCTPVLDESVGASNTLLLRTAALTACLCFASTSLVVVVLVVVVVVVVVALVVVALVVVDAVVDDDVVVAVVLASPLFFSASASFFASSAAASQSSIYIDNCFNHLIYIDRQQ